MFSKNKRLPFHSIQLSCFKSYSFNFDRTLPESRYLDAKLSKSKKTMQICLLQFKKIDCKFDQLNFTNFAP